MKPILGVLTAFWNRHAGGLLPYARFKRSISMSDGAQYDLNLTWFRRTFRFGYDTPNLPRSVRRARAAEDTRLGERFRRVQAGEPLVQPGDLIPAHAYGLLSWCAEVRASDQTIWKRAEGDERHPVDEEGHINRDVQYDWVQFVAGEWGHTWCTTGVLLDLAPLTVLKLRKKATR